MLHRPGSGRLGNRSGFQGSDTTKYRPTTRERGTRCTARERRFLRGRRNDDRTRRSGRHSGWRPWKRMKCRRCYCRFDQRFDILGTGLCERSSTLRRRPTVSSVPDVVQVAGEQGPRLKRSSIPQLKLRTRCARCRKLEHRARECPGENRGQRNDERYDRRGGRLEDNSKDFIAVAGHTARRRFFPGASWTFVALDPGEVLWDAGAQEGLVGEQQLKGWCKLSAECGLQVEWS